VPVTLPGQVIAAELLNELFDGFWQILKPKAWATCYPKVHIIEQRVIVLPTWQISKLIRTDNHHTPLIRMISGQLFHGIDAVSGLFTCLIAPYLAIINVKKRAIRSRQQAR